MSREKTSRNNKIRKMRKAGVSYIMIAGAFGLNKKTVYEIVNGYYEKKNGGGK